VDSTSSRPTIELPPPSPGTVSLDDALSTRRSIRQLSNESLSDAELSLLLWSMQGLTPDGNRTSPSAGATYPVEIYVLNERGVLRYRPASHDLEMVSADDIRPALYQEAAEQDAVRDAAAIFVIAGVFERTAVKYGERSVRYVHMEVGHVGQNLMLEVTALGLGTVPVGSFDDAAVSRVLALPAEHVPLYVFPVGHRNAQALRAGTGSNQSK